MATEQATTFLRRLDAVEARLAADAARQTAAQGLTSPDAQSGERWDEGQVWAHIAEIVGYWVAETKQLLQQYNGEPVPFGRVKSDPARIAAIERDRRTSIATLWQRAQTEIAELRRLLRELPESAWQARGQHQARGAMPLERIVDEFLIGHLEEHAAQLDEVAGGAK